MWLRASSVHRTRVGSLIRDDSPAAACETNHFNLTLLSESDHEITHLRSFNKLQDLFRPCNLPRHVSTIRMRGFSHRSQHFLLRTRESKIQSVSPFLSFSQFLMAGMVCSREKTHIRMRNAQLMRRSFFG